MGRLFVSILICVFTVFIACKKDDSTTDCSCYDPENPECVNYDPCTAKSPVTADFAIERHVLFAPFGDTFVDGGDKFGGTLRFRALEDHAQYQWVIGYETLFTQEVTRNFSKVDLGLEIPIKLTVTKEPDTVCFPEDSGVSTKIRKFQIVSKYSDYDCMGTYRGVFNNTGDSVDIFLTCNEDEYYLHCTSSAFNKDILKVHVKHEITNYYIYIFGNGSDPSGYISYNPETNTLTMDYNHRYTYSPVANEEDKVHFVGRKID